jgi:uncharacterized protein
MADKVGAAQPSRPVPEPDPVSAPYWAAANHGKLVVQRCGSCRRYQFPPRPGCSHCGAADVAFRAVTGRGRVYSYAVVHQTRVALLRGTEPFLVAIVELEESPDALVMGNLLGVRPEDARVGLPVEVEFEQVTDGCRIPQFRLSGGAGR